MRVTVYGLWHLGSVTAACLAEAGHDVVGLDPDPATVAALSANRPPVDEPGLAALAAEQQRANRLRFTTRAADAVPAAEVVWVCFDTPVDGDDNADVAWVRDRLEDIAPHLSAGTLVLISSQVPVGFGGRLAADWAARGVRVACSPENLRLGQALDCFRKPDRVVLGCAPADRPRLTDLLAPFGGDRVWMSVASAEMTKHAVNAFLATSVAFINELARICEVVGADAKEVERGLKSEQRIGPRAYLSPGAAFAGGTLARDIGFLLDLAKRHGRPAHLFRGVRESNECQKTWLRDQLAGVPAGATVAVLGLTYKPGTDTLRRSGSVELCQWLLSRGVKVRAHDPAVRGGADELRGVELADSAESAMRGADVSVLATPWPEYRALTPAQVRGAMARPRVIDPTHFLAAGLASDPAIAYVAAGRAA
ncbi:UDP-glucose dehydrogenase family protein [Frigoriglobus tundricola]|uniref:UDP-glucose 6-dehydrogenase n=1 Tax=Frigoriglobus tundricola TaxID=2774151 RepID=A0A6M5YNY9_9BACT|nr:nucleotide sugar dehydrogenase [Frigoriglobus tundricola]QJW95080.1 UDP-glucose 6-dehydrogenase [Frigoriglobus tundricola]